MPFNSDTYYANKFKRSAWDTLIKVRDIKLRAATGAAYPWEVERMPQMVSSARAMMRLSLVYRSISNEGKRQRRSASFG
jgi:hypothetical protein